MVQELFIIGEKLRDFLRCLTSALEVPFPDQELERVFQDSEADQVSQKSYCFVSSNDLNMSGMVEEYEPETIWIQVQGGSAKEKAFLHLVDEFRLIIGPNGPIH